MDPRCGENRGVPIPRNAHVSFSHCPESAVPTASRDPLTKKRPAVPTAERSIRSRDRPGPRRGSTDSFLVTRSRTVASSARTLELRAESGSLDGAPSASPDPRPPTRRPCGRVSTPPWRGRWSGGWAWGIGGLVRGCGWTGDPEFPAPRGGRVDLGRARPDPGRRARGERCSQPTPSVLPSETKSRGTSRRSSDDEPDRSGWTTFGGSATRGGPVALRPELTLGLPLSRRLWSDTG